MSDSVGEGSTDRDSPITTPKKSKRAIIDDDDFFSLADKDRDRKKKKKKKRSASKTPTLGDDDARPNDNVTSTVVTSPSVTVSPSQGKAMGVDDDDIIITRSKSKQKPHSDEPQMVDAIQSTQHIDDDDDEDDKILQGFLSSINDIKAKHRQESPGGYEFTDENERERPYLLQVIPKLDGVKVNHFKTKGTKSFSMILKAVVDHYKKVGQLAFDVTANDFVLFWVTGKSKIAPILKPSSLRIPPPDASDMVYVENIGYTLLKVLLVPKSCAKEAFALFDELKRPVYQDDDANDDDVNIEGIDSMEEALEEYDEFDTDDANPVMVPGMLPDNVKALQGPDYIGLTHDEAMDPKKREGYFIINLKGKDGKKYSVRVHHNTTIKAVLLYYLKIRNLDASTIDLNQAKVNFDDENLCLDGIIGDTDIEPEEQVQIYV